MRQRKQINPSIDVAGLRMFLSASRTGNLSLVAKEFGITQPAVSLEMCKLEKAMRVPLFDRSTRPMKLTSAGRILQKRAEAIINEFETLRSDVQQSSTISHRYLRIGFSDSFGGCIAYSLLHRLLPFVESLSAYTFNTPRIIQKFLDDELDIAVATRNLPEKKGITNILLLTERFVVAAPKEFEGKIANLADLGSLMQKLPVIRFNDEALDSIQIERVLRKCGTSQNKRIEVDSNLSVLSLVGFQEGWTVMPPLGIWMARHIVPLNRLSFHDVVSATRSFYILYKSPTFENFANIIARESIDIIRNEIFPEIKKSIPLLYSCINLEDTIEHQM